MTITLISDLYIRRWGFARDATTYMNYFHCILLIVLVYFPLLAGAQSTLTFHFDKTKAGEEIFFNIPLPDGRFLHLNGAKSKINEEGVAVLKINISAPGMVTLSAGDQTEIYIEPQTSIDIDLRQSQVKFTGSLAKENTIVQSFYEKGIVIALNPI